jgi:two-component system, chemotaxis family, CheB/CheR fusion protein
MAGSPDKAAKRSPELDDLLEFLRQTRGFDFSGYKQPTLERRIRKRMDAVGVEDYRDYQDVLEVSPDEFTELFNTILINVTGFFRDKPAWDYVASEVLPKLVEALPPPQPIRVWSAGCASGEEPYTLAMILAELLGEDEFRQRVKIYATDLDEEALAQARHAVFSRDSLEPVPDDLRSKYFELNASGLVFRTDLRGSVIFGRNDLVQDAPISRIDLLVSRNALMYFTSEAQARILAHFNYALKDTGFLFLGKSEMLITHTDLFAPHSLKWRVFKRVPQEGLRERLAFVGAGAPAAEEVEPDQTLPVGAFESSPLAQLLVDRDGSVTAINRKARGLFGLGRAEMGGPLQDLELSYRPADLRSALQEAYERRATIKVGRVPWPSNGKDVVLEVEVAPLLVGGGDVLGALVTFEDVTVEARLDEEHRRSKRQLETAYEELQSTVEELETTNEELHSTNEELETTNEELQSTNEELETMNQELQSTNHELETMNEEHQSRSNELDRLNLFFEGILESLGVGVVVLDRDQRVQAWNDQSYELWGLRSNEVRGEYFLNLDTGLPVERLGGPISESLSPDATRSDVVVDAVNRRGRAFQCWVRTMPLVSQAGEAYGVILLMADRQSAEAEGLQSLQI